MCLHVHGHFKIPFTQTIALALEPFTKENRPEINIAFPDSLSNGSDICTIYLYKYALHLPQMINNIQSRSATQKSRIEF